MTPLHELHTARLRLAPWGEDAVDEIFAMHADPRVARFLDAQGRGYDRTKAEARVIGWKQEFADHGLGKFRLERLSDGAFVGRAGLSPSNGTAEIGYSLAADHWGQGYASEIALGLRDWFFANRPETHFIGFTHVDNLASRRVLEKIGMTETHQGVIADMPHQFYVLHRQDSPTYPRPDTNGLDAPETQTEPRS